MLDTLSVDWRSRAEELEEENRQLREAVGASPNVEFMRRCANTFGIPPGQARLLSILMAGKLKTRPGLLMAYSDPHRETPDISIINTLLSYLRKALKPHGLMITNVYGEGWILDEASRARIAALLGMEAAGI